MHIYSEVGPTELLGPYCLVSVLWLSWNLTKGPAGSPTEFRVNMSWIILKVCLGW